METKVKSVRNKMQELFHSRLLVDVYMKMWIPKNADV